jgi:hypothetical protein
LLPCSKHWPSRRGLRHPHRAAHVSCSPRNAPSIRVSPPVERILARGSRCHVRRRGEPRGLSSWWSCGGLRLSARAEELAPTKRASLRGHHLRGPINGRSGWRLWIKSALLPCRIVRFRGLSDHAERQAERTSGFGSGIKDGERRGWAQSGTDDLGRKLPVRFGAREAAKRTLLFRPLPTRCGPCAGTHLTSAPNPKLTGTYALGAGPGTRAWVRGDAVHAGSRSGELAFFRVPEAMVSVTGQLTFRRLRTPCRAGTGRHAARATPSSAPCPSRCAAGRW